MIDKESLELAAFAARLLIWIVVGAAVCFVLELPKKDIGNGPSGVAAKVRVD